MVKLKKEHLENVKHLFTFENETLVLSCLQGLMGEIYADDEINPACACAVIVNFAFLAGDSSHPEADKFVDCLTPFMEWFIVPQDEGWENVIKRRFGEDCGHFNRYAIKKDGDVFDREKLQEYAENVPEGYEIVPFDENIYEIAKEEKWSCDFSKNVAPYELFRRVAIGYAALYNGELVAGASTFSYFEGGIEIEIDTREDHQGKGLATACGSRLILECLKRGLYPSWDAATKISLSLAEKLGYHFSHEYITYYVNL
ncbi:MAG: GNAT family N-acetyltransferase [Clostridiales bacterium]|nr:GNAT family N-acetyltransferase [Clostridiales bacterium]